MHYLVYNKSAGRGRMPGALDQATAFFRHHGMPLTVLPKASGASLTSLLRELPVTAPLLCLGGDGTVNGLLEAAVGTGRTVGILPAGSADDFATALALPRDTLGPALEAVRDGHIRTVDSAMATLTLADDSTREVRFLNALGSGFDAEVARLREKRFAAMRGSSGYYLALVLGWLSMRREQLQVVVDDSDYFEGRSLLVSCQNSARTGGSFYFAPGASIDDGRFELVVAADIGRRKILNLLPKVTRPDSWADATVRRVTGTGFTFSWAEPRTVHIDGEIQPPARRVDITVMPASLRVYAPAPSSDLTD